VKLRVGDRAPAVVLGELDGSRMDSGQPRGPVVVSFARYAVCPVCPVCQVHVGRIAAAMPDFRARSCEVLYAAFGVETGVAGHLHPRSLVARVQAMVVGKRHGRFEGREAQMPADFVLDASGGIRLAHYGRGVGDDAPVPVLLVAVDSAKAGS
jgi:peroxiredoxin